MMKISKKVMDRIASNLKKYQNVAAVQKSRDVSEADTVTLVKDILAQVFGYDKYEELTSEQQIRGTFCDLAVKIEGKIKFLIEVKAAGIDLNDAHLRQALSYGANEGIEWVALTNAAQWRLYKIRYGQPIDFEEVSSFNLLDINLKNEEDCRKLYLLCREGLTIDAMSVYHRQAQILNKFMIAQIMLSEPVVTVTRREIRKLFPDLKVEQVQISDIIANDVLKREVIEGEKVKEIQQRIKKAAQKAAQEEKKKTSNEAS